MLIIKEASVEGHKTTVAELFNEKTSYKWSTSYESYLESVQQASQGKQTILNKLEFGYTG